MSKRQLVYYIATTVDNFIAHTNGSVEGFLTEGQHIPDYINSLQDYDTVIMGKNTYEFGYQYGLQPGDPVPTYSHMMQYVLSRSMEPHQHEQLQVIQTDAAQFVADLKQQVGGSIYLCGGGQLAGYLLEHQLIDQLILKINPVAFGTGISLFGDSKVAIELELSNTRVYSNGVLFLNYTLQYD